MVTTAKTSPKAIRETIHAFLQDRLQPRLDKLKPGDGEKRKKLMEQYDQRNWIADAARRVSQIRRVTHGIKYSHPDARGSSLFSTGNPAAGENLVGTHCLARPKPDVVGWSAALDVYKFLQLDIDGTTILELAQANAKELIAAFGGDDRAEKWVEAFADIDNLEDGPATHRLARQIYWPVDEGYHLLAPLFPSSLVQSQYERIRSDRYSEEARSAREAHGKKESHAHGYREYPDLAIIKFGGTQPQNISHLNSERHGEAWLLPSLPPQWNSRGLKPPLHVQTLFGRWLMGFSTVRESVRTLKRFLESTGYNNRNIRRARAGMTQRVIDQVLMLTLHIQQLPSGWSNDPECRLNPAERLWLDPGRMDEDEEFAAARDTSDWKERVADEFGNWMNRLLDSEKTPMTDIEHAYWREAMAKEMSYE